MGAGKKIKGQISAKIKSGFGAAKAQLSSKIHDFGVLKGKFHFGAKKKLFSKKFMPKIDKS